MTTDAFLSRLRQNGFLLKAEGDALAISPWSKLTPELKTEIASRKAEILRLVRSRPTVPFSWSAECLESERSFGIAHARLYPLCDRRVETPYGPGRLKLAFRDRAEVALDSDPYRVVVVEPEEVWPIN
jgi:hypothetical protein